MMNTQFEIRRNKKVIRTGTFEEVMHWWDLVIGQVKPVTKEEKRFTASYSNSDLLLIPTAN